MEDRGAQLEGKGTGVTDRLLEKLPDIAERLCHPGSGGKSLESPELDLTEGECLPDCIVKNRCHAAPLAFLGDGKFGGERAELGLVGEQFVLGEFPVGDVANGGDAGCPVVVGNSLSD